MNTESQTHQRKMQALKDKVDSAIERADVEKSVLIFLTGDGKGKSSSAFGMVMRSLGYGHRVAVVQFIKGVQLSGEEIYLKRYHPEVPFYQMGTGFTWDTQDRENDIAAAKLTWDFSLKMLQDPLIDLVVLDELTYMLGFSYLNEDEVVSALMNRPTSQSVVITGRGGGSRLREMADTVVEMHDIKHAFRAGIKARKGLDF
jgi:cob(I)alamin adenosyltransferase